MPPLDRKAASELIRRRHDEFTEHERRWRFLQDSLEGGNRYRYANYVDPPLTVGGPKAPWYMRPGTSSARGAIDPATGVRRTIFYGVIAEVNLIPHLSETSADGYDLYALRLERTPVPTAMPRAIRKHLSRIYGREVARVGPDEVVAWWEDVDGSGTPMDKYMRKVIAPLILAIGQLDLCFDHPAPPDDAVVASKADADRYGLSGCVMSYILPENMPWWRLAADRSYAECLIFERRDDVADGACWRHWTAEESNAYSLDGVAIPALCRVHPFGRVPIVRVFDERKARCANTGQSRFEALAELQREAYNKSSELVLADVHSSHPTLQGPQEFVMGGDGTDQIPAGPGKVLPMKKDMGGNGNVTYEGWSYVEAAMTSVAALREHLQDTRDEGDREAFTLKPAGQTQRSTTAQSGVSKQMDEREGNDFLSEIAQTLADAEIAASCVSLDVQTDGKASDADHASIEVTYPKQFDLTTNDDLMNLVAAFQALENDDGRLPLTKAEAYHRLIRVGFPGLTDDRLKVLDDEIDQTFEDLAAQKEQAREAGAALATASINPPANGQGGQGPPPGGGIPPVAPVAPVAPVMSA